jgi:hypothetical protein
MLRGIATTMLKIQPKEEALKFGASGAPLTICSLRSRARCGGSSQRRRGK